MDSKQNKLEEERVQNASSEEIRGDIRGTRREMDETLDELGERLHPRHLLDDVLDVFRGSPEGSATRTQIRRSSKRIGRTIASELKEHPLPALLVGAGLVWWIIDATTEDGEDGHGQEFDGRGSRFSSRPSGRYFSERPEIPRRPAAYSREPGIEAERSQAVGEGAAGIGGSARSGAAGRASASDAEASSSGSGVSEKMSEAASSVGDKFSEVGGAARHYSERGSRVVSRQAGVLQDRFRDVSEDYPLAVSGAFLAAGILAGLLLPRTEQEDEWVGEASDELKERGEELVEQGKEAAAKTAGAALDEAEARGLTPDTLAAKAGRVASEATKAAKETAREEGVSASDLKEDAKGVGKSASTTATREGKEAAKKASS